MKPPRSSRPSPALAVAVAALVFAVAGTALAGAGSTTDKVSKATVKSIAKKEIAKATPGLAASATTATATEPIEQFDSSEMTDLVSGQVTAPRDGVLLVWGQAVVNADIHVNPLQPTHVALRGAVDGSAATIETAVASDQAGPYNDQTGTVVGAIPIEKGAHTVSLQADEAGPGEAYIGSRAITSLWVPKGGSGLAAAQLGR